MSRTLKQLITQTENWVFDWSGTLVDDLTMVIDATNHVLETYGKAPLTRAEFKQKFRLPYTGFYEEVLPDVPLSELEDHFRAGFAKSAESGTTSPLLPHALDLLESLHKKGKRLFILSSMDAKAFDDHAVELAVAHYFEATYAGVLDKRGQIVQMLEKHTLSPQQTIFVGDMTHDVDTARHGGVTSIAVLTGYQNEQQLTPSRPDYLLRDLSEIIAHI